MIKITETKTIKHPDSKYGWKAEFDIIVAPAKLVLVEFAKQSYGDSTVPKEGINNPNCFKILIDNRWIWYKPILISETEKPRVDDMCINLRTNEFFTVPDLSYVEGLNKNEDDFKVLALPEHFSPQTLQDITEGKLKDGDKVYVECEITIAGDTKITYYPHIVKLNPHITLHKVEEKMYTREEVLKVMNRYADVAVYNGILTPSAEDWLDQNDL